MNSEVYRNFISMVECGTMSAAAQQLHIAQPVLSNQLKALEKTLGAELFSRNTRRMTLTDAGKIFYDKARSITALEDALRKEIDACVDGAQGSLRIGMTQAYPDAEITQLLTGFQKENPLIRYEFYELNSNEIMELLKNNIVEVGIVRTSGLLPPDLQEQIRLKQKLCITVRRDNPWISPYAQTVSLTSLVGVPLAISRGFEGTIRDVFQRADIEPMLMSISTSRMNPMMWVHSGAAAAIVCTGDAAAGEDEEIICRELTHFNPDVASQLLASRSIITEKGRRLSAAAERFILYSKRFFQN